MALDERDYMRARHRRLIDAGHPGTGRGLRWTLSSRQGVAPLTFSAAAGQSLALESPRGGWATLPVW